MAEIISTLILGCIMAYQQYNHQQRETNHQQQIIHLTGRLIEDSRPNSRPNSVTNELRIPDSDSQSRGSSDQKENINNKCESPTCNSMICSYHVRPQQNIPIINIPNLHLK